jgi:pSer/pThr/pTyr-binding forkhead associated (FHA) protein
MVVINSGRRITLEGGDDLLVGRKDNQRGIYPDVDLGLDGGYDAGVSRRHAIISPQGGGFVIEDLASANGTFVNGRRLQPETPTPIRHGDELKFGTLILRFEID